MKAQRAAISNVTWLPIPRSTLWHTWAVVGRLRQCDCQFDFLPILKPLQKIHRLSGSWVPVTREHLWTGGGRLPRVLGAHDWSWGITTIMDKVPLLCFYLFPPLAEPYVSPSYFSHFHYLPLYILYRTIFQTRVHGFLNPSLQAQMKILTRQRNNTNLHQMRRLMPRHYSIWDICTKLELVDSRYVEKTIVRMEIKIAVLLLPESSNIYRMCLRSECTVFE